jgi:RNA polymerase sigma-70 factor (family 1)
MVVHDLNMALKEKELLLLMKQGDEAAFSELYNSYKYRLAGNLYKLVKSDDLAKELLQELFVRVWIGRNQIDLNKSFRSYLFRIAENLVYDYYRLAAKDKRLRDKMIAASSEIYTHIEEAIFFKEHSQMLNDAIQLMPPQRKRVFVLFKIEGKSYKEIEQLMGISEKTINSHLFQANRFLKAYFNPASGAGLLVVLNVIVNDVYRH